METLSQGAEGAAQTHNGHATVVMALQRRFITASNGLESLEFASGCVTL
ncbi:hypothetical protein SAMN05421774_10779 [Gemmobacter megaterium]|uniref:Uncharacterized protein n=1 Tax=Gemmobacter megaterium TaxID=1086013 RepID=A0A1N7Q4J2_9RHOB|nr:hypothetical protein SAMN05421774_10779 [Gemmobacter megaterium]